MDDTHARLASCFQIVFPGLAEAEVASASPQTVRDWDSIANVTLISVIEEEFEIEVPLDELELASFDSMLRFVRLHTSA